MKQVSYHETETVYQAGLDIEHAQFRVMNEEYEPANSPQEAWNQLPYWEREESPGRFEVFRFVTTTEITKVDPPYTREPK